MIRNGNMKNNIVAPSDIMDAKSRDFQRERQALQVFTAYAGYEAMDM